ncbi:MAG: protein kinase family protein [Proteobacteria bacterium]|nr:protein kinase family protein [Pseudomonadota bacterium]
MKRYLQFVKSAQKVRLMLEEKVSIPIDLNRCLLDKEDKDFYTILSVVSELMNYIVANISRFQKNLLLKGHTAKHISRNESKNLFPLQIIKTNKDEYYIVFSYKNKITDWKGRGLIRTAKEALILKIVEEKTQWIKGVDSVAHQDHIDALMNEIKLMELVDNSSIHKIIEGSLYTGKNGILKKSVVSEFAEGGTIGKIIDDSYLIQINLNLIDIFIIFYGCVVAMCELHKIGIIHRDAHEGNFFLFFEENKSLKNKYIYHPKISDFDASHRYQDITSDEFKNEISEDVRRLLVTLIKFLKISFSLDKNGKKIIENLLTKIRRIDTDKVPFKYDTETLIKEFNNFIIEIRKISTKSSAAISKHIRILYPEYSTSLFWKNNDSKENKEITTTYNKRH